MSEKDPAAFRTISEVAEDLDLPQHVLRFWETKFSQIRPMKSSGGRRFYRPDDVVLLRAIREMLYGQGYTIKGVQRLLKERGARSAVAGPVAAIAPGSDPHEAAAQVAPPVVVVATPSTQTGAASPHLRFIQDELQSCIEILRAARVG